MRQASLQLREYSLQQEDNSLLKELLVKRVAAQVKAEDDVRKAKEVLREREEDCDELREQVRYSQTSTRTTNSSSTSSTSLSSHI